MTSCWIAFGGNLGDVPRTFDAACESLRQAGVTLPHRSRVYETAPMGAQAGGRFCNAAAELQTELPPLELLRTLQQVETAHGRTRDVRWGPRTLDLDLILYGAEIVHTPQLTVPHPACWFRRFVLDPLVEIAPQALHPVFRRSVSELRARLLLRPLPLAISPDLPAAQEVREAVSGSFGGAVRWVADPGEAVLAFAPPEAAAADPIRLAEANLAHCVRLGQGGDSVQAVMDMVRAALDEPRPLN